METEGKGAAVQYDDPFQHFYFASTGCPTGPRLSARLDVLRAQIVPLENEAQAAITRRKKADQELQAAKAQAQNLATEARRLEATRLALEQQIGTLSRVIFADQPTSFKTALLSVCY